MAAHTKEEFELFMSQLKETNELEEAFAAIPSIYNLTTIKDFISKIK